mmetsp:Transcript_19317/g.25021  ORF Transcript_19317/g.25021 Transcript_19317/m.25021 type:complete len:208 (+) Transcript_19317:101-724(+)
MEGEKYDHIIKVILIGDSGVGKSNMVGRFIRDEFLPDTKSTIGVEFATKTLEMIDGSYVKAQIWDTAGQERYRSVTSSYYRGALGAMIVYDVTDIESFRNISMWVRDLKVNCEEDCLVMLVGNKSDLSDNRAVTLREGRSVARKEGFAFIETSAKLSTGIDTAFERILEEIYKRMPESNYTDRSTIYEDNLAQRLKDSELEKKHSCC